MYTRKVGADRTSKITIRLTPEDRDAVAATADRERISQTSVIERAIRAYVGEKK